MFVQGVRAYERSDNSDEASDDDESGGDVLQVDFFLNYYISSLHNCSSLQSCLVEN